MATDPIVQAQHRELTRLREQLSEAQADVLDLRAMLLRRRFELFPVEKLYLKDACDWAHLSEGATRSALERLVEWGIAEPEPAEWGYWTLTTEARQQAIDEAIIDLPVDAVKERELRYEAESRAEAKESEVSAALKRAKDAEAELKGAGDLLRAKSLDKQLRIEVNYTKQRTAEVEELRDYLARLVGACIPVELERLKATARYGETISTRVGSPVDSREIPYGQRSCGTFEGEALDLRDFVRMTRETAENAGRAWMHSSHNKDGLDTIDILYKDMNDEACLAKGVFHLASGGEVPIGEGAGTSDEDVPEEPERPPVSLDLTPQGDMSREFVENFGADYRTALGIEKVELRYFDEDEGPGPHTLISGTD